MAPGLPMGAPVERLVFEMGPITCHAWNKERDQLACSFDSNVVYVFQRGGPSGWTKLHELDKHDLRVTSVDWAPETNRIVTCAQDKNAFVWTCEGHAWKPVLVVARLNRAATCVKWSPLENKIAIGSCSKFVSISYYESGNDWWVSKQIKKPIRSTVSSIDWHPNNMILAVGSYDFRARVFSAYIKHTDGNKQFNCTWSAKSAPVGTVLAEYSSRCGWIRSIRFSPSGNRLTWVGQDSSIHVVDSAVDINRVTTLKLNNLPFTSVIWLSEGLLVAGGFDCCPMLCSYKSPDELKFLCKLDVPSVTNNDGLSAMSMFRSLDMCATTEVNAQLKTLHQNSISDILPYRTSKGQVQVFSTSAKDGVVILWPLEQLKSALPIMAAVR